MRDLSSDEFAQRVLKVIGQSQENSQNSLYSGMMCQLLIFRLGCNGFNFMFLESPSLSPPLGDFIFTPPQGDLTLAPTLGDLMLTGLLLTGVLSGPDLPTKENNP